MYLKYSNVYCTSTMLSVAVNFHATNLKQIEIGSVIAVTFISVQAFN